MKLKSLLMSRNHQGFGTLATVLDELGIEQDCCVSAQEAIEKLACGRYSALILDFDVPGAAHVAKLARRASPRRRPVIFAMIGASTDIGATFEAGANFVLYKPLSLEQVARSLRAGRGFMRSDRRRSVRQTVDTVVYLRFGKSLAIPALMLDLNEDGLSVQAAEPLPAVEAVPVRFRLPGTAHPIEATAEVIWADDGGRAGMFFTQLASAAQRSLRNWLTRQSSKKAVARVSRASRTRVVDAVLP